MVGFVFGLTIASLADSSKCRLVSRQFCHQGLREAYESSGLFVVARSLPIHVQVAKQISSRAPNPGGQTDVSKILLHTVE